ncbi:MAG: HDIG domain-containing protein [Acidobacteria bacterium]|nr:MAG: HDIG domain-containing protein [Acidobacteriota bacterium]
MTDISSYALAIIVAVGVFGGLLGVLRYFQLRRVRLAARAIDRLEGRTIRDYGKAEGKDLESEDEEVYRSRALYGIPYLAWILTSLVIPVVFCLLFFENLVPPFAVPEVGHHTWFAYRAPTSFVADGVAFRRHQVLIDKNKVVAPGEPELIREALSQRSRVDPAEAGGTILLLTIFCIILLYHINILYPSSTEKNRNLILIYVVCLVVLATAKLSLYYSLFSPYLIPIPWAGMIIAIFLNRRIVPLIMLITLIFVSMASGFDFRLFLVLLSGGLLPGAWVRRARRRNEVLLESVVLGSVMVLVYLCYSMLRGGDFALLSAETVASFLNGIVSGLMVLIFLPFLEIMLDLASPFKLMELLDLDTPVLKEFFFKAPGTYQHSMAVANIGETVANEIGANGLLVRVGAYYHDIGKMFNPSYFIENQAEGKNPHDELGPVASAAVVRSHVILGIRLAREIGLPRSVIDFIPEHHGTSTIDYFYYKSKQLDSEIKSEKIFKYPGPKPQTKETAVVMLVDSVEAAFRVVSLRDEDSIRELVTKIANRKMEQGELDRSCLTIGDLKKITDTLTHILKSSVHQRIAYPEKTDTTSGRPEGRPEVPQSSVYPGRFGQRS